MLFVKRIIENTLGKRVSLRFRKKYPTRVILKRILILGKEGDP
jgi:hypothetical protein